MHFCESYCYLQFVVIIFSLLNIHCLTGLSFFQVTHLRAEAYYSVCKETNYLQADDHPLIINQTTIALISDSVAFSLHCKTTDTAPVLVCVYVKGGNLEARCRLRP